jgi:hypothetical protein
MIKMIKYLKVDLENCYGISFCDTKEEVIEGCGYDVDEITFEELLIEIEGIYEIVEVKGDFELKWLVENGDDDDDDEE